MTQKWIAGRYIKKNHGNYLPKYIVAFSVKTDTKGIGSNGKTRSHSFRCVHCISARIVCSKPGSIRQHTFTTQDEFWSYIYSLSGIRHTLWGVSHNTLRAVAFLGISKQFLQSVITTDKPRSVRDKNAEHTAANHGSSLICLDSPPTIIGVRCQSTRGRIVFVDTLNYFRLPLSEIGQLTGRSVAKIQRKYQNIFEAERAARLDSQVIFDTFTELMAWVREQDMGLFRYTAAGQSYSAFRHRGMHHKILIHDNVHVKDLERTACFGGRVEVFKAGKCTEPVWQLDVNGLYPYVMRNHNFPRRLIDYDITGVEGTARIASGATGILARVSVRSRRSNFPARIDRGVAYPTGQFCTSLCGPELEHASRAREVVKVDAWAEYELAPLFTAWIDELWKLRQSYQASGNKLYRGFVKMLLNSLYGKFQQRSGRWVDSDDNVSIPPMSQLIVPTETPGVNQRYRTVGWQLQKEMPPGELDSTFVAIAAFVTSYARMYMTKLRAIAGREHVFYQGNDSLIVDRVGLESLDAANCLDETALGKMKVECVADSAEIFGVYDYRIGNKVITAGRSAEPSWSNFAAELQERWNLQASIFAGDCRDTICQTVVPWHRAEKPIHGRMKADGWIVPIHCTGDSADCSTASDCSATSASPIV